MKKFLFTVRIGTVLLMMLTTLNWSFAQCKLMDLNTSTNYTLVFVDEFNYNCPGPHAFTNNDFNTKWKIFEPRCGTGDERHYYDPSMATIVHASNPETDGHILRLTARRVAPPVQYLTCSDNPNHALYWLSAGIETNPSYQGMDNSPYGWADDGWSYGIFEIKCKLPADPNTANTYDVWPAFWLYSGATEIDPIDDTKSNPDELLECGIIDWGHYPADYTGHWIMTTCSGIERAYNPLQTYDFGAVVTYNGQCYEALHDIPQTNCGRRAKKIGGADLSSAYHIYSVVWTPENVTFFLNGREINTIPKSRVGTTNIPAKIIAELQMYEGDPSINGLEFHMDIDWIKVWKPKNANGTPWQPHQSLWNYYNSAYSNYTSGSPFPATGYNYYKSSTEYMNHNIQEEGVFTAPATSVGVHPEKGSIAFQSANEVYYRGTDNKVYKATYNGYWSVQCLHNNSPASELVGGALSFHAPHNMITYVGQDGKLQFFVYAGAWYHGWIGSNFPLASFGPGQNVSSVSINTDGDIFYKGIDYKLYRLRHNGSAWIQMPITMPTNTSARVLGDIITVSSGTRNIFYKGFDNRLQEFWKDGNGNYNHNWIDNNWTHTNFTINSLPGSMAKKSDYEIAYIGIDNKIHLYSWTGSGWVHSWPYPTTSYGGAGLGYPNADFARNGIEWDDTKNTIVYGGFDGRIQYLKNNSGTWTHWWVDDYWNTGVFNSFTSNSQYNGLHADVKINNGKIFYVGCFDNKGTRMNTLRYFNIEPCQEIETVCEHVEATYGTLKNAVLNTQNHENKSEDFAAKIYPNPTDSKLSIEIQEVDWADNKSIVIISNIAGQILLKEVLTSEISELDISNFASGIYFIEIRNGEKSFLDKIIKR